MAEEDGHGSRLWGNITSGVVAFVAAIGLTAGYISTILSPVREHLITLDGEITSINTLMAPLLTLNAQHTADVATIFELRKSVEGKLDKSVFDVTTNEATTRFDQNKADFIRTLEEISHQVHDLEGEIVTRAENDQRTAEMGARVTSLERRVDALSLLVEGKNQDSKGQR